MPIGENRAEKRGGPERIVVIGNCQAEVVAAALRHPAFGGRFGVSYHFVDLPEAEHERARRELARCTTVLVQDIRDFEDYRLRAEIPEHARTVRFPCLRFASLWPFDGRNGPDDKTARQDARQPPLFAYVDGLLGRLRHQIPDPARRFEAYRSLAVERVVNVARIHEFEERRLSSLDGEYGCSIGRFILDRFRTERLFRTTGDPGSALYRMLIQLIVDRLGAELAVPNDFALDGAESDEVPVHPIVARTLGVTWADEATTYLFHGGRVRWEDYIRRYIAYFG
jgi:hypothetical protein